MLSVFFIQLDIQSGTVVSSSVSGLVFSLSVVLSFFLTLFLFVLSSGLLLFLGGGRGRVKGAEGIGFLSTGACLWHFVLILFF